MNQDHEGEDQLLSDPQPEMDGVGDDPSEVGDFALPSHISDRELTDEEKEEDEEHEPLDIDERDEMTEEELEELMEIDAKLLKKARKQEKKAARKEAREARKTKGKGLNEMLELLDSAGVKRGLEIGDLFDGDIAVDNEHDRDAL